MGTQRNFSLLEREINSLNHSKCRSKWPADDTRIKTQFIGIGKAGTDIIESLSKQNIPGKYVYLSNIKRFEMPAHVQFVRFIPKTQHVSSEDVNKMLQHHFEDIEIPNYIYTYLLQEKSKYIVFAGLGQFTSSVLTKLIVKYLHEQKQEVITCTFLPFVFEGSEKRNLAIRLAQYLSNISFNIILDLESIRIKHGNIPVRQAHDMADKTMIKLCLDKCQVRT